MEQLLDKQLTVEELHQRLEVTKADLRDLATMGAVITSIQEIQAILSVVMEMAIRLVDGEVGLILIEEHDMLNSAISWGVNEELIFNIEYEDSNIPVYTFENRKSVIVDNPSLIDENLSVESIISIPIVTADECYGVLLIINKTNGGKFTSEDQEKLEMLLRFVAVAIENSNLLKEKLIQQKTEQEMAIAKQVQETILPQDIDTIVGAEIGAVYFPARDVSGDFYEIVKINENRFFTILGDVSNKGVPAAMVMSAASGIIKATIDKQPRISVNELARITNDILCRGIIKDREMFITLFFGFFDLTTNELSYCNAGHLPGLLWRENERRVDKLSIGGPIIGQFEGIPFKEDKVPLSATDRLFLFTDGLTEAEDEDGQMFGLERTEDMFIKEAGLPPQEFCLNVKNWVDHFTVGCAEDTVDDFTILQVKVR